MCRHPRLLSSPASSSLRQSSCPKFRMGRGTDRIGARERADGPDARVMKLDQGNAALCPNGGSKARQPLDVLVAVDAKLAGKALARSLHRGAPVMVTAKPP